MRGVSAAGETDDGGGGGVPLVSVAEYWVLGKEEVLVEVGQAGEGGGCGGGCLDRNY